jgi:hypothetical protein
VTVHRRKPNPRLVWSPSATVRTAPWGRAEAELITLEEPDGPSHGVTLARRYPELAAILSRFLLAEDGAGQG